MGLERVQPSFFFFQAEDGIRDTSVTGVQTCALPIWVFNTSPVPLRAEAEPFGERQPADPPPAGEPLGDRKSTRLNSSHRCISYAVFCLKKKKPHLNSDNALRDQAR